jgi:cation transport regulator ChaB
VDETIRKGTRVPTKKEDLPDTIQRSPAKARRTWAKTHDSAVERYGEGEVAHRTAFAALKHSFERRGDRWEPKREKGPSDPRAANPRARHGEGESLGGVDLYGNSRRQLLERARDLGVRGRSRMTKRELARAIAARQ